LLAHVYKHTMHHRMQLCAAMRSELAASGRSGRDDLGGGEKAWLGGDAWVGSVARLLWLMENG